MGNRMCIQKVQPYILIGKSINGTNTDETCCVRYVVSGEISEIYIYIPDIVVKSSVSDITKELFIPRNTIVTTRPKIQKFKSKVSAVRFEKLGNIIYIIFTTEVAELYCPYEICENPLDVLKAYNINLDHLLSANINYDAILQMCLDSMYPDDMCRQLSLNIETLGNKMITLKEIINLCLSTTNPFLILQVLGLGVVNSLKLAVEFGFSLENICRLCTNCDFYSHVYIPKLAKSVEIWKLLLEFLYLIDTLAMSELKSEFFDSNSDLFVAINLINK